MAESLRAAGVVVGLLYDQTALDAAYQDLCRDWSEEEQQYLHGTKRRRPRSIRLFAVGPCWMSHAKCLRSLTGLKRRGQMNGIGEDETIFCLELKEIVSGGKTQARQMLDAYESRTGR